MKKMTKENQRLKYDLRGKDSRSFAGTCPRILLKLIKRRKVFWRLFLDWSEEEDAAGLLPRCMA